MGLKRLLITFLLAVATLLAQSDPSVSAAKSVAELPNSPKGVVDLLKSALDALTERVALLEQELLEVRLQRQTANGGDTGKRPMIEEEEPFDAAKMKASDPAEAEAVAKAVANLLPANVLEATQQAAARPANAPIIAGPRPIRRVEPVIPPALRNAIQGSEINVAVKVYIGATGEVMGTIPVRQGDPVADQIAAIAAEAVARWRFERQVQNGQPLASHSIVRLRIAK